MNRVAIIGVPSSAGARRIGQEQAPQSLTQLENKSDSILIHFDVDVVDFEDFPVADVPHYHGMSFDEAMSAFDIFIASPKFAALVITEFNADRDASGMHAERFIDAIAKTLGKRRSMANGQKQIALKQ